MNPRSDCWVCDDNPTICRCPLYGPEFNVKPPTIGSLFSGYGGLDMAVEAVTGAKPAWFCEWDDAPSKVLAHHWPHVPNHRDVTQIGWEQMPRVDILTGGTPCQDLSHAGKRAGMTEGTRSNLWVNMREAIATIRPRLVVWENVQGALSAKATSDSDMEPGTGPLGDGGGGHLRALGRVLGDLAEIGYDAAWTTLRASDVGAPHHRARVFLVAWPQEVPDAEGCGRDNGPSTHDGQADREIHAPGHDSHAAADAGCAAVWEQPAGSSAEETETEAGDGPGDHRRERATGNRGEGAADPHILGSQAGHERPVGSGEEVPVTDGGGEALPNPDGERRHGRNSGKGETGRGQPTDDSGARIEWGAYAPAVRRWERLTRPAPAPTELNRNNKPRLNAAFAEWVMGLPAGHVTAVAEVSRAEQLKMIGNGVVPQQAAAAIRGLFNRTTEVGEQFTIPI